ncbi:hypothetical protein [Roseibium aggregatum]|uniref:Uncharacterized protein n=1 Tax=Roseibium aggregatum TaxID=187304 RepID=A0A939EGT2_9HYPH|nr:hypothetical protein [Roseibium aggregatum]MBN9672471.1 hypothetical protein [Roseibium aggregatum]
MTRKTFTFETPSLAAFVPGLTPLNGTLRPGPTEFDFEGFDVLHVKDVSSTDLGGTVVYDEVIPFDAGQYSPPDGTNGPTGSGGRIKGALQSRVVRSDTTKTLIFAYRFRDMTFFPGTGPQNKGSQLVNVELVTLKGFPKSAFPVEMYSLDMSQSLGAETLTGFYRGNGAFEFNTFLTEPEGTTFFEVLTKATQYTTGSYLSLEVDARGNGGGQYTANLSQIAVPA